MAPVAAQCGGSVARPQAGALYLSTTTRAAVRAGREPSAGAILSAIAWHSLQMGQWDDEVRIMEYSVLVVGSFIN